MSSSHKNRQRFPAGDLVFICICTNQLKKMTAALFFPTRLLCFTIERECPIAKANKQHKQSRKPQRVTPSPLYSPRSSPPSLDFWKSGIQFKDKPGQAEVKAGCEGAAPALCCQLGFSLSLCLFRGDVRGFITQGHDLVQMDAKKSAEKQNRPWC